MLDVVHKYRTTRDKFNLVKAQYSSICSGSVAALMDTVSDELWTLGHISKTNVEDVMDSISTLMTKSCVSASLPLDQDGLFEKVKDGIRVISDGDFFDDIASDVLAIPLDYTCDQLESALNGIRSKISTALANITALDPLFTTFGTLMDSISTSLASLGSLLGCATQVGGIMEDLEGVAEETVPSLHKSIKSIRKAKETGATAGDLLTEAKNRMTAENDYDTEVDDLIDNFTSKIGAFS